MTDITLTFWQNHVNGLKMHVCIQVSQEERIILWEVTVSVILSKKLYMNMCPIPNGFRDRAIVVVWLGHPVLSFAPAPLRERRSIFWEVIVSVILSKKLYKTVCPIPNGFRHRAIWLYSGLAWGRSIVYPSRPAVLCLKSNGSVSETVRNRTHVHIKFLLRITDTMTSQNIVFSSWDILYIYSQTRL
jgi:hypothetical protein